MFCFVTSLWSNAIKNQPLWKVLLMSKSRASYKSMNIRMCNKVS